MSEWIGPLTIVSSGWILGKEVLETSAMTVLLRVALSREAEV